MDGVDAVLLEIEGRDPAGFSWRMLAYSSLRYADERRARIRAAVDGAGPAHLCRLHVELGEWLSEGVHEVCRAAGVSPAAVDVVGSHGHTLWHLPPGAGRQGATLQLGDAATLAERTGVPVVSDFRSADVAAGGHGAPLVPWPDRLLFSVRGKGRALQNLGGIGNVTWLPPRESDAPLLAFDTGPGNVLLDLAAERATSGRLRCDMDGALAGRGRVDEALLARLLSDPFFALEPPRSTGRELFGPDLVDGLARERGLEAGSERGWPDLLATLTRLTARSIGQAYRRWVVPRGVDEVVLTGGGALNPTLAQAIAEELAPLPVRGGEALGMDPGAREAAAFAVLAWAHLVGVPANAPSATGARGPRILGSHTPGPRALVENAQRIPAGPG
jgi:anhydro-N-acetylmuramic acid kinase